MPILQKLVVQDFRNISLQEMEFSPKLNCIWGGNGEGKTNLLDALHYLAMTKSAFASSDRFSFRHGCQSFAIAGTYLMDAGLKSLFTLKVTSGGEKKLRRDDKPIARISDHIGTLPVVMVSPYDSALVSESGEERRRLVNSVLSQMDREYLHLMQQYNRLLQQRNSLLHAPSPDPGLLDTFDASLSEVAAPIFEKRAAFAANLAPIVADYYSRVSGGKESVGISYRSELEEAPLDQILAARREKDLILKYTSAGVQRDDFLFTMDGHPIRKCGSQGQQKSFLVALKFAQYELMKQRYGYPPALLLDDLFDKLDPSRVSNLLSMVSGSDFGQIFLTDTDRTRLEEIVSGLTGERSFFEAAGGAFTKS